MQKSLVFIAFMIYGLLSEGQITDKINVQAVMEAEYAFTLCKFLHQHPELSFQEFETAARMAKELEALGFEVTRDFGGNNVVGVFKNGAGPVIMLRTDMDALPIEEKTGLPFATVRTAVDGSGNKVPVMHACGHDIHMSVWTGSIRTLVALKDHWKGTILAIAQESEEVSGGATKAIENGLFQHFPRPDAALAYHINPELPSGTVAIGSGPVFAGVKTAEITVYGKGGHGAYPEKTIDPVVIAARLILDLQTIVSRELSPLEPAVVTVGSIHGGTRPNIIPDEVKLELTLRYYSEETLEKMVSAIHRISNAAAQAAGMPGNRLPLVKIMPASTPPVLNNPSLSGQLHQYTAAIIGAHNIPQVKPAMIGEDFGKYGHTAEKVPISLMWLGSTHPDSLRILQEKGEEPAPLHSPHLNPDYKATIETGIRVMTQNVIGLMNIGIR